MATGAYTFAPDAEQVRPCCIAGACSSAVLVTTAVGAVIGLAAARLRGPYLAGLTLAVAVVVPSITSTFDGTFNSDQGLSVALEPAARHGPGRALAGVALRGPARWSPCWCWPTSSGAGSAAAARGPRRRDRGPAGRGQRRPYASPGFCGSRGLRRSGRRPVRRARAERLARRLPADPVAVPGDGGRDRRPGPADRRADRRVLLVALPAVAQSIGESAGSQRLEGNLALTFFGVVLVVVMLAAPGGLAAELPHNTAAERPRDETHRDRPRRLLAGRRLQQRKQQAVVAVRNTPGVTDNEILVGTHQPLTGPAAAGYSEIAPATKAYFDYVNANGGVYGRKITYKIMDDGYNPATTQQVVRQTGAAGQGLRDPQRAGHADPHRRARLPQDQPGARPVRGQRQPQLEPAGQVSGHVRLQPRLHRRGQDPRDVREDHARRQEGLFPRPGRRLRPGQPGRHREGPRPGGGQADLRGQQPERRPADGRAQGGRLRGRHAGHACPASPRCRSAPPPRSASSRSSWSATSAPTRAP